MTIQGAIDELMNLLDADDVPIYYKPSIEKVIDTIILDRARHKADRKTEPQRSGTPYEIETSSVCKTEPQTSCKTCRYGEVDEGYVRCAYYSKSTEQDEPQTDCYVSDLCKHYGDKQICGRCRSRNLFCEAEPQPRCPKCGKRGYIRSLESMGVKLKVFDEYKWKCTNCNKYFKEEPKDEPQTDSLVIKKDTIPKEKLTHKDCGSCKFHDWEWDDFIGFRNICNASDTDTCPTPKYEPQFDKDINVRSKDEPQTYVINPQEPTNDDKCFECDDFFTCDGQCDEVEDKPQTDCSWK